MLTRIGHISKCDYYNFYNNCKFITTRDKISRIIGIHLTMSVSVLEFDAS